MSARSGVTGNTMSGDAAAPEATCRAADRV